MPRERRAAACFAFVLTLGGPAACDETAVPPIESATASEVSDLEVMWAGCVRLDDDGGCQRTRRPLRVWVSAYEPQWRWTISGVPASPVEEQADGGTRFSFNGERFDRGMLALSSPDAVEPLVSWRLVPDDLALSNFDFGASVSASMERDVAQRQLAADALLAEESATERERLVRVHQARRLAYDGGDAAGSAERILPLLEEEERLAASQGRWLQRCEAALVGLHWGIVLERAELYRRWGPLEEDCRDRSDALTARFDYYLGERALLGGQYAEGEARLAHNALVLKRLLPEKSYRTSVKVLSLYARTGRWSEAEREMQRVEALPLSTCERVRVQGHTTFVRLRALQTGEADLGDPRPGLKQALEAHTHGECENADLRVHDLTKLGFDAVVRRDAEDLRWSVAQLDDASVSGKYRQQHAELRLVLAVLEARFDDVPALADAMASGMARGEPEARWRHHMWLAEAAMGREDRDGAEAAYRAAEQVLDEIWSGVDSGAVRARWLAAYRRSALGLMALHLEAGEPEAAACAARVARLRALELPVAGSGAQGRCARAWSREPDEVVFLIVPETDKQWLVFVLEGERVVASVRVPRPVEGEETQGWWDRWTPQLNTAKRVRILASGAALRPALHLLSWQTQPLVRQRPVTFGLDLEPEVPRADDGPDGSSRATVVFSDADPLRTLGRYAESVRAITGILEQHGWAVDWSDTPDASGMAPVVDTRDVFVYFGHGKRVGAASQTTLGAAGDVGSTALLLRDGGLWGADDVAALAQPPRRAVLLGCEVGFPDVRSWSGGLNLAHAFLLAGTEEVLATTEPLDATAAADLAALLFDGADPESFTLSGAPHRAWRSTSSEDPATPWGALRVWSR